MTSRLYCAFLLSIIALHCVGLAWMAAVDSPTFNEPAHLVAGLSNWQLGRFNIYSVNPPLVRMVAAVPALLSRARTDWHRFSEEPGARPEFDLAREFIAANGERSLWIITLARWACIPFSVLGAYICFRWARDLYGSGAGLLSLTLWCFCPNILAHGHLITSDVAATALGITAGYTFWRWLKQPTWWHTLISGLVLGAAELAKTTLVIFYPLWPLMWLAYRWPQRPDMTGRDWLREAAMLAVRMIVGLYVINMGYGFEGTFTRLGDYRFISAALGGTSANEGAPQGTGNRFAGTCWEHLPVPLPKHYVVGIDLQKQDFENYKRSSYFRGRFSGTGWWYYYLYALAIKVPLGTWLLLGLASSLWIWRGPGEVAPRTKQSISARDEFILVAPAAIILTFVSSQTGFSEHMRYVLPIFPFVFVWIGRIVTGLGRKKWIIAGATTTALAWSIASSMWIFPHSLSYFNELVRGPRGGPAHLILSNVDWGQDLVELKHWLAMHPKAAPLNLLYFGYFDPRDVGWDYSVPDQLLEDETWISATRIPPGWYAVSVNFVRGCRWYVHTEDGSIAKLGQNRLTAFQEIEPVAMAGYSIYIYHVEP
jgi:4-amino-4-deoxy-L-arabinose transferase-like glycosyltransferase